MTNLGNGDPQKQIEEMLRVSHKSNPICSRTLSILSTYGSLPASRQANTQYASNMRRYSSGQLRLRDGLSTIFFYLGCFPFAFINWQLGRVLAHISLFVLLAPPGMELVNSPSAIVHLNEADNSLLRTCIRQSSSRSTCASFPARTQRQVETLIGRRARTIPCLFSVTRERMQEVEFSRHHLARV